MERRHIAGPAGQYQYQTDSLDCNQLSNKKEVLGSSNDNKRNLFNFKSWVSMCNSLGFESFKNQIDHEFKHVLDMSISDIKDGTYDLKVPRMIAYVYTLLPTDSNDWILELMDSTGSMNGFISLKHLSILTERGMLLRPGSTILLEHVSIFVSIEPYLQRYLNLHSDCFISIWN